MKVEAAVIAATVIQVQVFFLLIPLAVEVFFSIAQQYISKFVFTLPRFVSRTMSFSNTNQIRAKNIQQIYVWHTHAESESESESKSCEQTSATQPQHSPKPLERFHNTYPFKYSISSDVSTCPLQQIFIHNSTRNIVKQSTAYLSASLLSASQVMGQIAMCTQLLVLTTCTQYCIHLAISRASCRLRVDAVRKGPPPPTLESPSASLIPESPRHFLPTPVQQLETVLTSF